MTPKERVGKLIADYWDFTLIRPEPLAEIGNAIERAINAAVEEDRKTRPHQFVGRLDRWCEVCNEPDRDERHVPSRETLRNSVKLAVEEEREACAKIADEEGVVFCDDDSSIAARIRARSTAFDR